MFIGKIAEPLYWPNRDWLSSIYGIHFMLFSRIYIVISWSREGDTTVEE